MKHLTLILVAILAASGAMAQEWGDYGGIMGAYFSDTEFSPGTAVLMTSPSEPFDLYVVLTDVQLNDVGGYECGLEFTDPALFVLSATGPNGWINFGSNANHIVGYVEPLLPDADGNVVLSTLSLLYPGSDEVDIVMGPSTPSSGAPGNPYGLTWDGPIIGAQTNPDVLLFCHLSSGAAGYPDVVARLNPIPLATEQQSWTQVKNLFE